LLFRKLTQVRTSKERGYLLEPTKALSAILRASTDDPGIEVDQEVGLVEQDRGDDAGVHGITLETKAAASLPRPLLVDC